MKFHAVKLILLFCPEILVTFHTVMRFLSSLLFFIFACFQLKGQDSLLAIVGLHQKEFYQAKYVEDLSSMINITPMLFTSRSTFTIKGNQGIDYSSNDGANIGIKAQHLWLGLGFSYSPKSFQDDKKGPTTFTNVVLNSYGKKVGFDIYYQDYKGFYVQNYKSFPVLDSSVSNGHFPLRSDIQTTNIGFNVYYIFHHKRFSYRAAFSNNDLQKKSSGSFTLGLSGNYYKIRGDSSILITRIDKQALEETRLKDGSFYSVSLMPGYAFTLVAFKHAYFNFSPAVGIMLQSQDYLTEHDVNIERWVLIPRAMARTGIGYADRRFYSGISMVADAYSIPLAKNLQLNYVIGNITFYTGMRLSVPKSMQKVSDFINKCDPGNIFLLFSKD